MNELTPYQEAGAAARPNTLLDKETFQQIAEIASVMASASLIPTSLSHEGSGDRMKPLPPETVRANCFLVANQAIKWRMDPFAVAQCCSVVHGRLMFEGKLVAAVLEANLGIKLVHAYGKWDKANEACILGEDGAGDDLAIRIGEGRYNEDGVAVFAGRFVDGHVGAWKTTGTNSPWRPGRNRVMLIYRGSREFARIFEPGVMLGVITDDEYDPAYNARDITPARTEAAGQSVIDQIRAGKSKTSGTAGFDHDRITETTESAAPHAAEREEAAVSNEASSTEGGDAAATTASSPSDADKEAQESSSAASSEGSAGAATTAEPSPDQVEWRDNIAKMLWAGTNPNSGDEGGRIFKAQNKAAAEAYPLPAELHPMIKTNIERIRKICWDVIEGKMPAAGKQSAVHFISNITGMTVAEIGGEKQ